MLRIEKVFLQGFKSFCDPTEVVFDAEGITAVVGPNGCGKSNVADALSWVIGEQRAKALRGSKMEDVIFQGSRNRQPSGMAEVVLTLHVFESFEIRAPETETTGTIIEDKEAKELESLSDSSSTVSLSNLNEEPISSAASGSSAVRPARSKIAAKNATKTFLEGEKITVARRLYRTGESEYEMNGRTCRLRDIQDLFAGTGLGGAHYAIIEQGRIGQVLSARPLDRRALIEEAAGISKFKMRQRAAELKLEAAKQNLSRVTDIIAEVERQQSILKRQAAKARRFQRLRSEMRELTKAVLINDYRQTQKSLQELEENRQEISRQESELTSRLHQAEEARQTTTLLSEQLDLSLLEARTRAGETNLQIEKTRQQQNYLQEQINALAQRSQQSSQDQIAISERNRLLTLESDRLRQELRTIESEINVEANSLSQAEKLHTEQSAQDNLAEKQLEQAQRNVTESATHRERWRQLVRQFQDALERCQKNLAGLTTEQARASEQAQKIEDERLQINAQLAQSEQQQQQLLAEIAQIKQALANKQVEAQSAEASLADLQKQATAIEQRLKSLLELDERRAYFSEAIQAVIQESRKSNSGQKFNIIGTLADFVKVSPKHEAMVEVGLREELQYLLTPSFEDALSAIEFLKREQRGRATFLVLNSSSFTNGHGLESESGNHIVRLIDLLGLKPDLRQIIQQALPRLAQTVVTEKLHQAIQDSISTNGKGHSFLTASGEFVSAGHIISGGSSSDQGNGVLALKREIEELQTKIAILTKEITLAEEKTALLKAEGAHLAEQNQSLDWQQRELEKDLVQQRGLLQQCEREKERAATHLRVVEVEIAQANTERGEFAEKLHHAEIELQQAEAALTEAEQQAATALEAIVNIRAQAAKRAQDVSSRRADFAAKSERRKGLQNDLRRLENEAEDINRRLSRSHMEAAEAQEQDRSLRESLAKLKEELTSLTELHQTQLAQVEKLNTDFAAQKEKLAQLETKLAQLREELTECRENRAEIDILRTKFVAGLEHMAAACLTELGENLSDLLQRADQTRESVEEADFEEMPESEQETITPEDIDSEEVELSQPIVFTQFPVGFDLEQAKARLEELRAKVEAIGPVNLLALEELGELEERLAFLLEQKADIEQAVSDTLSVISELKKRSRDRFTEAFHQINRNFSEMFLELFGGGHGEMRLIDESDVLESGIDIIAQPPGKRLQNVLLLSGGEKAMVALALVMGIFKYRPSPFCLLDEVDAPLDDVNIGRFSDKILEMSQHTQFMVITHSKRTMEAAKTLYGVTMEDPGVSKLISVRLT